MSYSPPDWDAVDLSWSGKAAYTPPDWDAADLSFTPDVATATLLGVGLLGAPALTVKANASAILTGVGLLGAPVLTAQPRTVGWLAGSGLLGAPVMTLEATGTTSQLQSPGLLGVPAAMGWAGQRVWLASSGLLGAPRFTANPRTVGWLTSTGLLGSPRQTGFVYPAAAVALPVGVTTYHGLLTGAPDGVADLVLPLASFSVRHKEGTDSSYQLAIPGVALAGAISARPHGEIVIAQRVAGVTEELLRGDLGDIRVDRGATSGSLSISGNSTRPAVTGATYVVTGCSYQYSTFTGENRLRIDPRAGIRPGDYVRYRDTQFRVGSVTWSVAVSVGSMGVTMEVATA